MDEDQSSKDDFLGRVSVAVSDLESQGQADMWLTLDDTKSGKIRLRTFWLNLSCNTDDLALQMEEVRAISTKTPLSAAVLIVFLDSAKHLPRVNMIPPNPTYPRNRFAKIRNASKAAGEPSPQVQLVVGQQERWSSIKHSTNDPVWEEIFYLLLSNPEVQELDIKVVDNKCGQVLGHLSFRLSRLLKEEGLKVDEPLVLLGTGHQAKLQMTLQLRLLSSIKRRSSSVVEPLPRPSRGSVRVSDHEELPPAHRASLKEPSSPPSSPKQAQVPSLDEVVHSTVSPILDSMAMGEGPLEATNRDPQRQSKQQVLKKVFWQVWKNRRHGIPRKRRLPMLREVLGDPGAGKLQLTLRYSAQRSRMVVVVHRAVNLPHKEGEDLPDPYVKLQLLPDRSKENKRKTQVCRNTCNPVFDESMEYEAQMSDLEGSTLQVLVNSKSGSSMFSRGKTLGRTQVSLANLDLAKALTDWYELEPDA
ncbi:extended synaptotagmin-like protein 2 [Haemaphysalis longicornis]